MTAVAQRYVHAVVAKINVFLSPGSEFHRGVFGGLVRTITKRLLAAEPASAPEIFLSRLNQNHVWCSFFHHAILHDQGMSKLERVYHLHNILSQRRTPISRQSLMEQLGCSQATLYRLIADLRDHLGAPIEQDPESRGFFYDQHAGIRPFELPGIWLSPEELQALMSAKEILGSVQPGLMEDELDSLRTRIEKLLDEKGVDQGSQSRRIRIIHQASRLVSSDRFRPVLSALVTRRRLQIRYRARGSNELTERVISPQRLTSYRHNWYVDAWCHLRKALRSFALECIEQADILEESARDIPDDELGPHFTSAYGIFSGPAEHRAVMVFSAKIARWVSDELWHSKQEGRWLDDGRYELRLPYGKSQELVMDILRYGPDVEVMEPPPLRQAVQDRARATAELYRETG